MNEVKHIDMIRKLCKLLDNQFEVAGFRFGIDPLLGLFPIFGDIIPITVTFYMVWFGYMSGMETKQLMAMIARATVDVAGGFVPVIGDLFDLTYKSHSYNLNELEGFLRTRNGSITSEVLHC